MARAIAATTEPPQPCNRAITGSSCDTASLNVAGSRDALYSWTKERTEARMSSLLPPKSSRQRPNSLKELQ